MFALLLFSSLCVESNNDYIVLVPPPSLVAKGSASIHTHTHTHTHKFVPKNRLVTLCQCVCESVCVRTDDEVVEQNPSAHFKTLLSICACVEHISVCLCGCARERVGRGSGKCASQRR